MILLKRRRIMRYVRKGMLRENAFEDWADDDGVIHSVFTARDICPVAVEKSKRADAALARLESHIRAAHNERN